VALCASAGITFDPWQQLALEAMLWERPGGRWSAFEVGLLLARQNGKNEVLMGRELYGLFVANEPLILHSAHEYRTADEAFRRIKAVVTNCRDMSRKVKRILESHGEEGIELLATPAWVFGAGGRMVRQSVAPRLRFLARTGGAARGFTASTTVWDEAFNLPDHVVNAQLPTMSAVPNPQLIYASSAVDQTIHPYGVVLARVRARALAGQDPALAWLEWQGDETRYRELASTGNRRLIKEFLAEPQQHVAANPAVGYRISLEHTVKELRTMSSRTFAVERLNIGDWPAIDEDETVIDMDRWAAIADPESRPTGTIALSADVSPDRKWATIASAGRRFDDRLHIKIVHHRPGTHWIVDALADLTERYEDEVCAVVIDPAGPVGALIPDLHEAGIGDKAPDGRGLLVRINARELAQACGAIYQEVQPDNDGIRHCGQDNLDDAMRDVATRTLSDAWAWSRKHSGGDITPVVGVTLAAHGMRVFGTTSGLIPWVAYA